MQGFKASTFGSVDRQNECAGYRFSESTHQPKLRIPKHSHELASINFVIDGIYCEYGTATTGEFAKYELLMKPPGEAHSNYFGSKHARCLLIEFTHGRFADLVEHLPWMQQNIHALSPQIKLRGRRLLAELRSPNTSSRIAVESAILELLLSIDNQNKKSTKQIPTWLKNVKDYLHVRKHDELPLDDLASHFNVHATHLSRQFKRCYSQTIGDYVRTLRIEEAIQLLSTTDLPISQIAEHCGFSDQSHLGRWFKKITGTTPGQLRRSNI